MNGQVTMAEWLIENKNGKSWKKYGKERVYINVYVGGVQIANYFYDIVTDRFFGCDSKTEKAIRNEFEAATENKVEKLSKELETRKSMLRTQMRVNAAKEVIEENQKRIKELEEAIKAETTTEEVTNEEVTNEEVTNEEVANEEVTKKISTVDLQNFLSSKVSSAINAKVELKKIIKIIANKTQQTLQKEEVKEIATNKKISLVFQEQMLLLVFSRLEMTNKIYNLKIVHQRRKKRRWFKIRSEAQKRADLKYRESARGKEQQKKYKESEIGKQKIKEAVKKYSQTEKGKEKRREAVRRFRLRQKEQNGGKKENV